MPRPAAPSLRSARRYLAAAALPLIASCAPSGSGTGPAPVGRGPAANASGAQQGFDTSRFPGQAAMQAWSRESPYRWVGYYLPSPCHRDASWSGQRQPLAAMGWGFGVIYLGQQDWVNAAPAQPATPAAPATPTVPPANPPVSPAPATPTDSATAVAPATPAAPVEPGQCATVRLSAAQGTTEADDAIAKAQAEGFPTGTSIYLDVERVRTVSPALEAYVRAWLERVLTEGRYRPALYVHAYNAQALYDMAHAVYDAHGLQGRPRFWIANASGFTRDRAVADVGFPFADVWQGQFHVTETWGGQALFIDANLSTDGSPSAPAR